jgi:hypothetical protein
VTWAPTSSALQPGRSGRLLQARITRVPGYDEHMSVLIAGRHSLERLNHKHGECRNKRDLAQKPGAGLMVAARAAAASVNAIVKKLAGRR